MASTQSIAETRANALERLNKGFQQLADVTGVEAPVLSVYKKERDPLFAQAKMLEVLADWMDAHVAQIAPAKKGAGKQLVETPAAESLESGVYVTDEPHGDVFPLDAKNEESDQYDGMTKRQLRAIADDRHVDTHGLNSVAELKDALQAADGMTEDEQAAADKD